MLTTGEKMNSSFLTQLVKSDAHGEPGAGDRRVMVGFQGGWANQDEWANFRPSGVNIDAWNAKTKTHNVWSGTFEGDYNDLIFLAPMVFGQPVSGPTDNAGVTTIVYSLPNFGERDDIQPFSLEYGQRNNCERCHYGLVLSCALNADRDSQHVSGPITIICRKPEAADIGVPMSGYEAANQTYNLELESGGRGTVTLSIQDAAGVEIDTVDVAPGDASAEVSDAIEALAGIDTVNASGTIPAVVPTTEIAGGTMSATNSGGGANPANAHDGNNTTGWNSADLLSATALKIDYGAGNPKVIKAYQIFMQDDGAGNPSAANPFSWTFEGSNDNASWTELDEQIEYASDDGAFHSFIIANTAAFRYYRILITEDQGNGAVSIKEVKFFSDYASTGGVMSLEIAGPTHTRFRIAVDSQTGNGWSATETQRGTAGDDVRVPAKQPILVQQQSYRRADSISGLAAAAAMDKAKASTATLGNLAEPVWFADENETTYQSHVDGGDRQQEFSILLAETSTHTQDMIDLSNEQPAGEQAFEHRFVHPDEEYSLKLQHYSSVRAAVPYRAVGNVRAREFPLGPVLHDADDGVKLTLTYPTPA